MEPGLHYRMWTRLTLGAVAAGMWGWSLGCVLTQSYDRALGLGILGLIVVQAIRLFED